MKQSVIFLLLLFLLVSCEKEPVFENGQAQPARGLIQISVIDAILQGIYDGYFPIGELKKLGNFGIGTFHALDGEMVVLNDTIFQVFSTGMVAVPPDTMLTPFASVTVWNPDTLYSLNNASFDKLNSEFETFFPTPNIFYAIKVEGNFSYVKTRSVPRQEKPYPPLVDVTAHQPEFEFYHSKGTIVGFYCPHYALGINVTGFHLHFLTSDRKGGGHLLAFDLPEGTLELGYLYNFRLILPEEGDFFGGDFTIDRSDDLEQAEK